MTIYLINAVLVQYLIHITFLCDPAGDQDCLLDPTVDRDTASC